MGATVPLPAAWVKFFLTNLMRAVETAGTLWARGVEKNRIPVPEFVANGGLDEFGRDTFYLRLYDARLLAYARGMTRRSWLMALGCACFTACCNLGRYHSSVKFSLSNDAPVAHEPIEVTFDYLDDAPAGTWSMALIQQSTGAVVDESPVSDASSRVTLTPREPGAYSVQCRKNGKMVAHRSIAVR